MEVEGIVFSALHFRILPRSRGLDWKYNSLFVAEKKRLNLGFDYRIFIIVFFSFVLYRTWSLCGIDFNQEC